MRSAFVQSLIKIAEQDQRIMLLTADLGYTVLEPFAEKFPQRFINVGVAEQNMVAIATGLAEAGFIPYVYSISNFAALRPYEFIRNGPIFHQLPVRIIGVGSGFDYGSAGMSHYALEDIGVMRIQKGITVVVPADTLQTKTAIEKTWNLPGPVYYRIGKGDKNPIAALNGNFELGRLQTIEEGKDLLFVSIGCITKEVLAAASKLTEQGVSCAIAVVSHFNPSCEADLLKILKNYRLTISVEEHYITGGLGSFLAEVIAENNISCQLIRCGVRSLVHDTTGSREFMNDKHGLSSMKLVQTALRSLKNLKNEKSTYLYNTSDS